jgi:hypothetical protein
VDPHTTVIIPLDDRVLFVSLLNCAEFSIRLSEVAQTLDATSGNQLLAGRGGSESGGLLARSESGIAPGCERGGWGALRSFGCRLIGNMSHSFLFHEPGASLPPRLFIVSINMRTGLDKDGSAGPNCTV